MVPPCFTLAAHGLALRIHARLASGFSRAHGKRPQARIKLLAKMRDNIYGTTKVFRICERKGLGPKPKWQGFLSRNAAQHQLWKEWWNSPQADRWKNLGKKPMVSSNGSDGGGDSS